MIAHRAFTIYYMNKAREHSGSIYLKFDEALRCYAYLCRRWQMICLVNPPFSQCFYIPTPQSN
ncbi:hypothetical protein BDQ94DRAFT_133020 [Aspergillus welwitschiae]|uniref:Uncharacterized protein n=1 Tax=Aspergillus welwitschiae TaxID=1341132 RepID=A0A3F3QL13_9EURO|nr:hypothetical protein BDQ94DRAFT_133020 [Aspergillus welwitschiae]RDH39406.1 hypothetical protein BDQ94DRAFT_133020 [Aspergillus welwitschiae]